MPHYTRSQSTTCPPKHLADAHTTWYTLICIMPLMRLESRLNVVECSKARACTQASHYRSFAPLCGRHGEHGALERPAVHLRVCACVRRKHMHQACTQEIVRIVLACSCFGPKFGLLLGVHGMRHDDASTSLCGNGARFFLAEATRRTLHHCRKRISMPLPCVTHVIHARRQSGRPIPTTFKTLQPPHL